MLNFFTKWLGPHKDVRLLQLVAFMRNTGQGIALVDMSLFLKDLGWSGESIGTVLAGAAILRTILTLFASEINGLLGAKRYLLLYEAIAAIAALMVFFSSNVILLSIAIVIAGIGSGHSGSGGPTFPIERSWLAAYMKHSSHKLFHTNALLSLTGLGTGCLLACLPSLWSDRLPGANSYRPLFLLITLLTIACMAFILWIKGGKRKSPSPVTPAASAEKNGHEGFKFIFFLAGSAILIGLLILLQKSGLHETALYLPVAFFILILAFPILKLSRKKADKAEKSIEEFKQVANLLSGVTATLTSTMTSYWFSAKFGAPAGWIGAVMGLSYMAAGLWSLVPRVNSNKLGTVRSIIMLQLAAIACLLALPWTSSFWIAAVLEIACTACNLGTRGSRTMITMEERKRGQRTLFAKVNYVIMRLGAVLWPGSFGKFIDAGQFVTPFYIVAGLQTCSVFLYARAHSLLRLSKK